MAQKKIMIVLLFIILLPAIVFLVYEMTSMDEYEEMIDEIYQQQMNTILFSINQYAWDVSNHWVQILEIIFSRPEKTYQTELHNFLTMNDHIRAIFVADTTLSEHEFFALSQGSDASNSIRSLLRISWKESGKPALYRELIRTVGENRSIIRKLLYRKSVGYTKIESMNLEIDDRQTLLLIFITEPLMKSISLTAVVLDLNSFMENTMIPKVNDLARNEFILGIFKTGEASPLYSTDPVSVDELRLQRAIWLFPDHLLGSKLKGIDPAVLAKNRFHQSLPFIILLDMLLALGVWFVYRNIRREMELARMKSDFVSNVSHQLRTPLALIRMFAETLELGRIRSEEKKQEYYQIIGQETERLTHLMNNILDFSKIEAGKKQYHFKRIDLNDIVTDDLNIYRFHLQNQGFTLRTNFSKNQLFLSGDREAISEAIINLMDNAIKYSADNKFITIHTGVDKGMVYIEVEDRGIGIPAGEQQRIFEKFYRVSTGLIHDVKGSGLGLTLIKYIMDAHKGKIDVISEVGKGSRFRLLFQRIMTDDIVNSR